MGAGFELRNELWSHSWADWGVQRRSWLWGGVAGAAPVGTSRSEGQGAGRAREGGREVGLGVMFVEGCRQPCPWG